MEIITGRTGTDHVYAADDAELYRMFIGSGDYVFRTGNQFNATMYGAYTIRVSDGSLITQGRLAKIRPTDGYDELQFDVGVAGYRRADLVVAEYRKTVTTHEEEIEVEGEPTIVEVSDEFEDISLVVLKGANNTGTYITPTYATGNIDRGEVHQVPLWEVRFNGVNFESLIDRRIFLDGVPYDTLIAHSQAVYAQANARVDDALRQVELEINRLRTIIDVAPLTRIFYKNKNTEQDTMVWSKWQKMNTSMEIKPVGEIDTFYSIQVKVKSVIGSTIQRRGIDSFKYGTPHEKIGDDYSIVYDGQKTVTFNSTGEAFVEWTIEWHEEKAVQKIVIPNDEYEYNLNDVFILYLNGLRILPTEYSVTLSYELLDSKVLYTNVYLTSLKDITHYDEVEIEVWRPETK